MVSQAARAAWAKLIFRVYEDDPLSCPRCGNEMRVIAVINEGVVIRQILQHLNLWNPRPPQNPARLISPRPRIGQPMPSFP